MTSASRWGPLFPLRFSPNKTVRQDALPHSAFPHALQKRNVCSFITLCGDCCNLLWAFIKISGVKLKWSVAIKRLRWQHKIHINNQNDSILTSAPGEKYIHIRLWVVAAWLYKTSQWLLTRLNLQPFISVMISLTRLPPSIPATAANHIWVWRV